jgi:hypothetical protein
MDNSVYRWTSRTLATMSYYNTTPNQYGGRDCMVVEFTTTHKCIYAISAYHHFVNSKPAHGEVYSI